MKVYTQVVYVKGEVLFTASVLSPTHNSESIITNR